MQSMNKQSHRITREMGTKTYLDLSKVAKSTEGTENLFQKSDATAMIKVSSY